MSQQSTCYHGHEVSSLRRCPPESRRPEAEVENYLSVFKITTSAQCADWVRAKSISSALAAFLSCF